MPAETHTAPEAGVGLPDPERINGGQDFYRIASPSESAVRSAEDGSVVVEGRMMPYGEWTEVKNRAEGHFFERFAPGALAKTISERGDRVRALFEHGLDQLGRQPVAAIDSMTDEDDGAYYRATLLDGVPDLLVAGLRRGLYGASVRFDPIKWDRVRSPMRSAHNPDGIEERSVREAGMREFSFTAFPIYANTTAHVRSITEEIAIGRYRDDPKRLLELIEHMLRSNDLEPEPDEATTPKNTDEPEPVEATTRAEPGEVRKPLFSSREDWLEWISRI